MDRKVPDEAAAANLDLRQPPQRALPLVVASPHSGAAYPDELLKASRLDPQTLRRSEDSFVDEIFGAALAVIVTSRDLERPAWASAGQTQLPHQPLHRAASDPDASRLSWAHTLSAP